MTELRAAELFRTLSEGAVSYVTIGGWAAVAHGVPRVTLDIDIVVQRTTQNLELLASLMDVLHAPETVRDSSGLVIDPRDAFDLARGLVIRIPTKYGPLDLIADPPGAPYYTELVADAELVTVDGVTIPIASRQHLLTLKRASGRPKDLADMADLERRL